jgi:colanic acid/amylovoran biosynthesis glycosyltransferase
MSVLFMMPQWEAASEVWMHRMLEATSRDLAAVVVPDSQGNIYWRGRVKAYSLHPPEERIHYFSRMFDFLNLSLQKASAKEERILRRIIHQLPITHILCHYGTFADKFMDVWRKTDIPLFVHFHGYDATFDLCLDDQPNKKRFSNCYLDNMRELSHNAIFIANSNFTKSLLIDAGISPDRVMVKYYGIPLSHQSHTHKKKDGIQILHLGRLVDFKSPDRTIRAFEIARSKGLDANLVIGGDGPLRSYCELLRIRSSYKTSITLLGEISQEKAQNLFSKTDIFTQHNILGEITQQSECFGVSIVEGMAFGLPVVGTRNGGVLETVVDGETGILVSPGDVEAQANAFLELARNPDLRQKMGDAGRARVSAHFSPQQEADSLRSIMKLTPSVKVDD